MRMITVIDICVCTGLEENKLPYIRNSTIYLINNILVLYLHTFNGILFLITYT